MARKRKFDAALGSVSAKQLTAVSLFCGAGGMDVGFNRAAFKTIWAADKNSAACATYNRYAQREIALRRDLAKISRSFGSSSLALPTASLEVRLVKVFLKRAR